MVTPTNSSSSSSSLYTFYTVCRGSIVRRALNYGYAAAIVLVLLPIFVIVLFLGLRRWKRGRSSSHTDVFTLHMMVVEICCVVGACLYALGDVVQTPALINSGVFLVSSFLSAETLFHVLTCLERYVAVVHPVSYRKLREGAAVRVRNASVALVWLVVVVWLMVTMSFYPKFPSAPFILFMGVGVLVVAFFCLSVIVVLVRPRPGDRPRADPSKTRAFHMMAAITAALTVRFVGLMLCFGVEWTLSVSSLDLCGLMEVGMWMTTPSTMVLPLLSLHRAGKLPCCRTGPELGP